MSVIDLYVIQAMSVPQIAAAVGLPRSTVYSRLRKAGVLRSRADGVRIAARDGRLGRKHRLGKRHTPETIERIRAAALARSERTSRGVERTSNGYIRFTRGTHKGKAVHIVIMEEHIGRLLLPNEVVHHINRVRDDNRLENLQLMTRSAHTALHRREDVR